MKLGSWEGYVDRVIWQQLEGGIGDGCDLEILDLGIKLFKDNEIFFKLYSIVKLVLFYECVVGLILS